MTLEVTVALVLVEVLEAVGVESHVKAPDAFVAPEEDKQNEILAVTPFAVTDPLRVAEVAPIEVASAVVAVGAVALIVKVSVFSADVTLFAS